jgi:hypothetical protein
MFSTIWGICFSLKANPNSLKVFHSCTVRAQQYCTFKLKAELRAFRPMFDTKSATRFRNRFSNRKGKRILKRHYSRKLLLGWQNLLREPNGIY